MNILKNPDAEYVKQIKKKLKQNNGYCPCAIVKTPDTKCRCKEFRDQVERGEPGACGCGLWIAVDDG